MAQQDDSTALRGRSMPIEQSDVELASIGDSTAADPCKDDQESDAAAALEGFVKEAAEGKAASSFEWQPEDLVNTPGGIQTLLTIWVFLLQKLSLLWHVSVRWPSFFLNFVNVLGFLCFKIPAFDVGLLGIPEVPEDCLFTAKLLLSLALLVRMVYVMMKQTRANANNEKAPRYGTAADVVRTVVLGVAAPTLLSALAIAIGAPTGTKWLTGLGVVLFWPIIGYLVLAHVARVQLWKSCSNKYGENIINKYWPKATQTELLVLLFFYFSAYLTGIGALLERLNPLDVTTPLTADGFNATNFTLAANATIETAFVTLPGEVSSVAVEAVYWFLLVFYALVPVAGCAFFGIVLKGDAPDDPTKYAEWLEGQYKGNGTFVTIQSKEDVGFLYTIIAPFEKKYSWYKALILLEAFMFAACVTLMPSDEEKLIASTTVTVFFTLIACYTRPYIEDVEDYTDICSRVFMLVTLGVGIALNDEDVGRGGQAACHVILAVVVLASNAMYLIVLNPLKLLNGVAKAVRENRRAAKIAGWDDEFIRNMPPDDVAQITAEELASCSPLQIYELLKHHGGSDSQLRAGIFSGVTELDLKDAGISGVTLQEVLQTLAPLAPGLEVLNLGGNNLGGSIMGGDFMVYINLKKLILYNMGLEGQLPKELGKLSNLKALNVSGNYLSGELPLSIGRLKANGCEVNLYRNKGFTLSADTTDVMNDTKLDFSECCLKVSDEEKAALKVKLPGCNIYF